MSNAPKFRHSSESWNPVSLSRGESHWIPAFAGMTLLDLGSAAMDGRRLASAIQDDRKNDLLNRGSA